MKLIVKFLLLLGLALSALSACAISDEITSDDWNDLKVALINKSGDGCKWQLTKKSVKSMERYSENEKNSILKEKKLDMHVNDVEVYMMVFSNYCTNVDHDAFVYANIIKNKSTKKYDVIDIVAVQE